MPELPTYEHDREYPSRIRMTSYGKVISPVQALRNCPSGGSFVVDSDRYRRRILSIAKRLKIKVTSARISGGKYSIWRTE